MDEINCFPFLEGLPIEICQTIIYLFLIITRRERFEGDDAELHVSGGRKRCHEPPVALYFQDLSK